MPGPGKSQGDPGSIFMQMREEKRKYNHLGWLNRAVFPACHLLCFFTCCQAREENKGEGSPPLSMGSRGEQRQRNPSSCWRGTKLVPCRKSREISDSFGCVKNIPGRRVCTGYVSSLCPLLPCGRACIESRLLEIGKTERTCHLGQKHGTPALWVGLKRASCEGVEEGRIHKPVLAFWGAPASPCQ